MKQIQIIGHLGADATAHNSNGNDFVRFSVAVSERWKDATGNKLEKTDWFSVFIKQKSLLPFLIKGTQVFVQGQMKVNVRRNDNSGTYQADLSINAEKVTLLSAAGEVQGAQATNASAAAPNVPGSANEESDDLPF